MKAKYYIIPLLSTVLGACSVGTYLNINTDHPADIAFKTDTTKILVINTFNFWNKGIKNDRKLSVIKEGAFTAINYAAAKLKQLKGTSIINLTDTNHLVISIDSITKLSSIYNADYVLALDSFSADFVADNFQDHESNEGKKKTYKTADYNIKVNTIYKLYEKSGNVYKQLNGSSTELYSTEYVPGIFLTHFFGPTIKNNESVVNQSAIKATDDALRAFSPYTSTKSRLLYNNDQLSNALNEISFSRYSKADSLLKILINNKNQRLAAKAAYNLAIVYEAENNFKAAIEMAQLSLDKKESERARSLLQELNVIIAPSQ